MDVSCVAAEAGSARKAKELDQEAGTVATPGRPQMIQAATLSGCSFTAVCTARVEDSIDGSWDFVISKKLSCALVIPFATKGAVLAVGAFTFCVGLALLAR